MLTPVCPPFARRATRIWPSGRLAVNADRALNRWWDYPRHARAMAARYELFHIVDHSYSQLVHRLPAGPDHRDLPRSRYVSLGADAG